MGEEAVCLEIPKVEAMADENASVSELKRDRQFLTDDDEGNPHLNKKQATEASNEDINSEISNPVASPAENTSNFRDTCSQEVRITKSGPVECGEVNATCLNDSSSEETVSDEEHSEDSTSLANSSSETSRDVPKSQFVLEIPKHLSSTGITKITLKLSKRKGDYDSKHATGEPISNYSTLVDVDRVIDENSGLRESHNWRNTLQCPRSMKSKMSKKAASSNYPSNVKKLLSTGILDGARVKYISTPRVRELQAVVHSGGYLCGCTACNFSKVLSAYELEQHAGAKTRHPNNHIFLENGKPIYSIIQELKTTPLDMFDEVIRNVAGPSLNEECFRVWKASFQQSNMTFEDRKYSKELVNSYRPFVSCPAPTSEENCGPSAFYQEGNSFSEKTLVKDTVLGGKQLTKRPSSHAMKASTKHKKAAEGGTRRRDNDLHRLLFMPNGLPDGTEVAYYVKGQKLLEGYKQGNGIFCSCCNKEISPSQFEAHAGMAARRQAYRHIYISTGLSLHDIAMSLANGHVITTGNSDDMCTICGDGGDLLLCDGCPQAFHPACLNLQSTPEGSWHCASCKDKSVNGCGELPNNGRPIVIRLTRVVKAPEIEIGGCVFCRAHDFSVAKFDDRTVILCDQCEKEYHIGCLRDNGLCDLKELPMDKWFCCDDCNRVHMALQSSVISGTQAIPASLFDTISRKYREKGMLVNDTGDCVQWRILSGKSRYPEHLPLLSRAAAIFRECFDPIVAKSGRDLIPVMVYGRSIYGQEFGGMYCVVLTVKSLVVSAGLLRIFGRQVAELPLVATSRAYQGKGYFQALFSCIESLLCSMNIENLVLPAAEEAESLWVKKFGFTKLTDEQLQKYLRGVQLTIFKGTSMLEKKLQKTSE